ncbi:MAG: carboxypeptidase regulatory-like domain-containing protein [Myxococcales bacterium]|nr:carboxypeptidase regulatory-like domain-containing protein [Myxococcales bacterium]
MKQRIILVLIAVAAAAGLWWVLAGDGSPEGPSSREGSEPGIDRAAIVARKLAARQGGEIDLSPASARGRVTDGEGGAGIAGAVVLLTPKGLDQLSRSTTPGEAARPLQARTEADGGWSLAVVPPGRYSLSAAAPGYLPATRTDVTLAAGRDNAGLDLSLRRGGHPVQGTISDIGGGPVEDVLVRVTRLDQDSPFNFDRPALGATTDDEGHFALQLADGQYSVSTFHPDYVEASQHVRVDGGPRTIDLTITPAGSIEGRVLDRQTRAPIEGAIVSRSGESSGGFTLHGLGDDQVVTDADGRFRLRGLRSGVARLSAVARGHATRQPVEVVLGVAEQVSGVELLVDRALTISGFVVARGDEERGLEGVLVGAFSLQPGRLYVASGPSGSDGYFEIFGVMPGSYTVGAVGEDALPNLMGTSAQVGDDDVRDVLVVMDAGVHIRGRVSPGVSARVSVQVDSEGMSMSTMMQSLSNMLVQTRTDDEGVFDLHPVAPGALTVVAEADDGSRGEVPVEVRDGDIDGLVVQLEPRASVRGQVVDARGEPGAGLTVAFRSKSSDAPPRLSVSLSGGMTGTQTATTDEGGHFVVEGLDAGDYEVTVSNTRGPSFEWAEPQDPANPRAPLPIAVAEGEQREGLMLVVEARDGVITGVVIGPDGEPMPDAWVTALRSESAAQWSEDLRAIRRPRADGIESQGDDEERTRELRRWEMEAFAEPPVLSDQAGRFEVRDLRAGTYRLRAEVHGAGARGFVDDVTPGADVRIALEPLAGLEGVVRFRGKPVVEYTLEVRGPTVRSQAVHATDGRFTMSRLDAGDYEVLARSKDGTARAEVEIAEGGTTSVELTLGGWSTLRGRVVDAATGDPIAGLSITVLGDGGPSVGSVMGMFTGVGPRTDEDGNFSVDEVPPGEGQIMFLDRDATGASGMVAQADYEVEAEQEQDLGTITGIAPTTIDPEERGSLGLTVKVATYAQRPRAPEAEDDEAEAVVDQTKRLWVSQVTPGGPAALGGLVPGDEIVSIDGNGVLAIGAATAARLLSPSQIRAGEEVALEIVHDGSRHTVKVMAQGNDGVED